MTDGAIRSLDDIWPLQAALNRKAGIDTQALGEALLRALEAGRGRADAATRVKVGRAMKNHIDALADECHEIQQCLSWKHWYREAKEGRQYELMDVQNARVEAIDMLFFWVSICQLLGLSPADIYRLYGAKLGINLARQDENRSQAEHPSHEEENRSVV
ncbi:MAG: hypothetical protein MUP47_02430 [Phycisphaerae bacterium]|nr:hypothetical protein [Phycisphaerae bacterium]